MEKSVVIAYGSLFSFLAKYYIIVRYLKDKGFSITECQLSYNNYSFARVSHLLMICDQGVDVSYVETTIRNIGAKANLLLAGEITVPDFNRLGKVGLNGLMGLDVTPEQVLNALSFLPKHSVLNKSLIVPTAIVSTLTDREKQVFELIAEGLTAREIGEKLFIAEKTVEAHRFNLMRKLNIHNKAQLIRFYLENCVPDR